MAPNSADRETVVNDRERVCAWCRSLLCADRSRTACRAGVLVSHGLCRSCAEQLMTALGAARRDADWL
jgi:hypothetical protein